MGNGTAALLNGCTPRELRGDTLIIGFPTAGRAEMCESNGRSEQIGTILSEHLGRRIRIKSEIVAGPQAEAAESSDKLNAQKRYEILNDPGVKAILGGLDATITKIEDNQ